MVKDAIANNQMVVSFLFFTALFLVITYLKPKLFPDKHEEEEDWKDWKKRAVNAEAANAVFLQRVLELQDELAKIKRELARRDERDAEMRVMLAKMGVEIPAVERSRVDVYVNELEQLSSDEIKELALVNFPEVNKAYGEDQSQDWRRLKLVEWARDNHQLPLLREKIIEINPKAFQK